MDDKEDSSNSMLSVKIDVYDDYEILFLLLAAKIWIFSICWIIIFTQPLRSGRIWHKVNFLSGV